MLSWSRPVDIYSASDMARVARAFIREEVAASGAALAAASSDLANAELEEMSRGDPPCSQSSATCTNHYLQFFLECTFGGVKL